MTRVVLASASPRRSELLRALLDAFDVVPAEIDEELSADGHADATRLAVAKAMAVATRHPDALVIGADTVVHDERAVYGKPLDEADAIAVLTALRGRPHIVTTGIAVATAASCRQFASSSTVVLSALSDRQIRDYVASGRPMDKAGAYAIQDEDVPTVAALDGCYCSVMGLPLLSLARLLEAAGLPCRDPGASYVRCAVCPESGGDPGPRGD